MRALHVEAFGDPAALRVSDVPARDPGRGEVQVRVAGVGIGYFDGLLVKGEYQIKPPLPFIPGNSISGVVEKAGEGVSGLRPGDPVAAFAMFGGMAELVTLDASACQLLPLEVPLLDAASFFVTYATGVFGLRECGHLQPGEVVLVLGASGATGTAAVEVAKAMGARVIACASTAEKRTRCLASGADVVVDYTAEDWRNQVKAASGRGVNVVFDPVGGAMTEAAFRLLAPGGRHLIVGFVQGIAKLPGNLPLLKRASLVGVNWGGETMENPAVIAPVIRALVDWTVAGRLNTAPDHVYPMERTGEAFAALFERRSTGRVVVTP
jgi:NADPH2:quinone reductase